MFTIGRILFMSTLLLGISVIARMMGILDSKYMTMIMYVVFAIQTILLIIVIIVLIKKNRRTKGVRIIRY